MTDRTALGDRMKLAESATRFVLPRRSYSIIRVDLRAAHAHLRHAHKPFDEVFMADMDEVAKALCEEISGAAFAYTQSDEISMLATDFAAHDTQPWFGGVVQKVTSVAAGIATAALCERRSGRPVFDARVFTLADPVEVANYFHWRQRDAVRNSITMAAQAVFSHKQLHGVNGDQKQEMLFREHGINWNDYPDGCKRGRVAVRETGEREVEYTDRRTEETVTTTAMRSWWETRPAPKFTVESGSFLARRIPPLPALPTLDADGGDPAPHRIALSVRAKSPAGGNSYSLTHPAACDRLPYGHKCWFDEARPRIPLPQDLGVYDAVLRDADVIEFTWVRALEAGDWHG